MPPKKNIEYKENLKDALNPLTAEQRQTLADELHHPTTTHFQRRKVVANGIDDIWSCDLMDLQDVARENNGYKYTLNIVDVFSKFAWCIPLKSKSANDVLEAFKSVFEDSQRKPNLIWVDKGSEFYNKYLIHYLKRLNISLYSTYSESKSVVVERFNRTIKDRLYKYFTAANSYVWTVYLPQLITEYNNKKIHSTIKMTPYNASKKENEDKLTELYEKKAYPFEDIAPPAFGVGDMTRISKTKGIFEKSYSHNWTLELFSIHKVLHTVPPTYRIADGLGEVLEGSFYTEELLLAKAYYDVFKVESIEKTKQIDWVEYAFIKYKGYSQDFNRWVPLVGVRLTTHQQPSNTQRQTNRFTETKAKETAKEDEEEEKIPRLTLKRSPRSERVKAANAAKETGAEVQPRRSQRLANA